MSGTHVEKSEVETAQILEISSGREAVARVENNICPEAVTREPAVAEGLALAGMRAASLSDGWLSEGSSGFAAPGASCVHHVNGTPGHEGAGVFELAASSPQQAVDQSLAAHLLSYRLGRSGVCSLASALAEDLSPVHLPGPGLVAAVLDTGAGPREPDAGPERILEMASEALRAVAESTGRPEDVVTYQGAADAQLVLVGSGAGAAAAQDAAEALSAAGVPAASLSVNLIRPFPEAPARDALATANTIFVVEDPAAGGTLLARVRAAVGKEAQIEPVATAAPGELLAIVAERLPQAGFDPTRITVPAAEPGGRLVVAPAGPWAERTLREVAAVFGLLGPLQVARRTITESGATRLAWSGEAIPEVRQDLLLASHPALLEPQGALSQISSGGIAVILSKASSSEELAGLVSPKTRDFLREREIQVHWLAAPSLGNGKAGGEADQATALALAGAALAVLRQRAGEAGAPAQVAARLEAVGRSAAARWLRDGAVRVQALDPADLDPSRFVEELDFRPTQKLPRMPEPVDDPEEKERCSRLIRRFHLTGKAELGAAPGPFVWPAALATLRETFSETSPHPFVLVRSDDPEQPVRACGLRSILAEGIERLQGGGSPARSLSDNRERLAYLMARALIQRAPGVKLGDLLAEGGKALAAELDLPGEEQEVLVGDLEALKGAIPAEATVLDIREDTPLRLYVAVREAIRGPLHQRFLEELGRLAEQLRDLLLLDRMGSSEGRAPEALRSAFGDSGVAHVDMEALSRILPSGQGPQGLDPGRRHRIQEALTVIEQHLEDPDALPSVICLRPPDLGISLPGQETWEHPDPLAAAIGLFDGMSRRLAPVFRAARIARLETSGQYLPEQHDELLADLDWEAFSAGELAVVPAVGVITSGQRVRQRDGGSLSELLCSSRPVHVIIQDEVVPLDEAEDLSRFHMDLGYLVMAHREAFAVGSSLARPDRLVDGLARMSRALRPAVALVHLPALDPPVWAPLRTEVALQGRVCPDFGYDPDSGSSWAERFDLEGNPQVASPWPIQQVTFLEDGTEQTLEVALTFADTVALEPAFQRHLWVIPLAGWDDGQLSLAEYLARVDPEGRERGIPYLWVVDEDGFLQRAVVTRELAMVCRDRLRGWRVLQELGGHANVFAERAAAKAREEALAEAEAQRAELEQAHAEELERVGNEAAQESMERLAAVLLNPEGLVGAVPAPAKPAAPPAPVSAEPAEEAAPEAPAVEEAPEEEPLGFDEPFIDSALCTTCNECTQLNGQLFKYNADKQAFIADPNAGSYAELVKAATLCPAKCIHPGKPRSDDPTATPEMIERAAPFN
jgi:ferredoxin